MNPWSDLHGRRGAAAVLAAAVLAAVALIAGVATAATSLRSRTIYPVERRVENIRAEPNGEKIGTLLQGTEVRELERDGKWVRFRLEGWIWGPSLEGFAEELEEPERDEPTAEGRDQRRPRAALRVKVPQVKGLINERYGAFYSVSYDRDLKELAVRFKVRDLSREALEVRQRGVQADLVQLLADELGFESVRVETNRPDGSGPVGAEIAITPVGHIGDPEGQTAAEWRAHTRRSSDGGESWVD